VLLVVPEINMKTSVLALVHETDITAADHTNSLGDQDADHKEFNGMDVEDWLAKQHEIAERSQARDEGGPGSLKSTALKRKQSTPREVIGSVGLLVDDYQTKLSPASSRPAQHDLEECNPLNSTSSDNISGLYVDQMNEEAPPGEVIDASIRRIENTNDFYIAELTGTSQNDGLLIVDGVRTTNPKVKRMLQVSCALAVASVLAVVAGMVTTRLVNPAPAAIGMPSSSNDSLARPVFYNPLGNLNWTIAEAAIAAENTGQFPTAMFVPPLRRQLFFERFNRTDVNFTCFTVQSSGIQIFNGLDISLLSKMLTDPWIGHVVSGIQATQQCIIFFTLRSSTRTIVNTIII
jgi:hypothetical protein